MTTRARRVFCIGETVLDIILQGSHPLAVRPGGSMLNSAISLGRAGIPVFFISEFATDKAGEIVQEFLSQNGVSTEYISRYRDGKTAIALAFLDDHQNAEYSFYKIFPEERLLTSLPPAQSGDIILFGSIYAVTRSVRGKIMSFLQQAKSNGAFIIYDPNFRDAHLGELETLRPWIIENIRMADLVRGSDEDFRNIFGTKDAQQAYQQVAVTGCPLLVYTKNSQGVEVIASDYSRSYEVPRIQTVSTIGAGDAFNAGIIYALYTLAGSTTLPETFINWGIRFSTEVCESLDNYISTDFGKRITIKPGALSQ